MKGAEQPYSFLSFFRVCIKFYVFWNIGGQNVNWNGGGGGGGSGLFFEQGLLVCN